jgi:hypothetical protein
MVEGTEKRCGSEMKLNVEEKEENLQKLRLKQQQLRSMHDNGNC